MNDMGISRMTDLPSLLQVGAALLQDGDAEGALQVYNDALASAPRSAGALAGKGVALTALGRYDQAIRFLQRACELEPAMDAAWRALGTAALAAGNGEVALGAYTRLRHSEINATENYVNLARAAYFALDLERARGYADLALAEDPAHTLATEWATALQALPDHAALLVDVGRAHARRGRFEQGLTLLLDSLKERESAEGYMYAGRALLALDRPAEAVAHLNSALKMDAQNAELLTDLASALALSGDIEHAQQVFDKALATDPEDEEALLSKAQLLVATDRAPSARALIDRLIALAPGNPSVWFLQGQSLAREGRKVSARLAAERGIVCDSQSPLVWLAAAEIMIAIGQDDMASLCHARARFAESDVHAEAPPLSTTLAPLSAEIAELDGVELPDERMAEALRNRVTVYANLGQVPRALEYLVMLLGKYPLSETEELRRHQGSLLRKLGDAPGARKAFERALELDPNSERARLAIRSLERFGA